MNTKPKRVLARRMRRDPVSTEALLWKVLRNRRLANLKFRRQVPVGPFVADFLCYRYRLIIEADGPFHDPSEDAARDGWLGGQGFRVLQFKNEEVVDRHSLVIESILAEAGIR